MKKLTSSFLALVFAVSISYSTPSKAAVGITTMNAAVILGGLAMTTTGTLIATSSYGSPGIIGFLGAIVGLIVLDGEAEQAVEFSPLTNDQAKKLGVSASELASFNAEIDQVNILFDEVALELESVEDATAQDAKNLWNQYEGLVSAETFSAMKKISHKSFR